MVSLACENHNKIDYGPVVVIDHSPSSVQVHDQSGLIFQIDRLVYDYH